MEPLNPNKGFRGFCMSKYDINLKIKVIKEYKKIVSVNRNYQKNIKSILNGTIRKELRRI